LHLSLGVIAWLGSSAGLAHVPYIIRANPGPTTVGEQPTYWVPQHYGSYTRIGDMAKALERGCKSKGDARAFMDAQGVAESEANEIIHVP
jgi:hypothetical protein